jgi:putative endonuclease
MGEETGAVHWIVYILECADKTLYTGITNDLDRRMAEHEAGKGAR